MPDAGTGAGAARPVVTADFTYLMIGIGVRLSPFLSALFRVGTNVFGVGLPCFRAVTLIGTSSLMHSPGTSFGLSGSSYRELAGLLPFAVNLLGVQSSLQPWVLRVRVPLLFPSDGMDTGSESFPVFSGTLCLVGPVFYVMLL